MLRVTMRNDNSAADLRGAILAIESRDMAQDSTKDTTAALAYDAADLTPKGGATRSGTTIVHASLTAGWLTILNSEIDGVGHMTHKGVRRPWIRAQDDTPELGGVEFKLRWRALGSLTWSENRTVVFPLTDEVAYQYLDMGECRPQPAALGDERWEWELQARAPGGSGSCKVARVLPLPTEQYMVVKTSDASEAADATSQRSPSTVANDSSIGDVAWSSASNAAASDNSYATARGLGDDNTQLLKATNLGFSLPPATIVGVQADVEGHVTGDGTGRVRAYLVKGGAIAEKLWSGIGLGPALPDTTDGTVTVGSSTSLFANTLTDTEVENSGFGVAIFVDHQPPGGIYTAMDVSIDHVTVTVFYTEATDENKVCFATRSIEFRSDGVYRQHPTDDVWGQVTPEGFLPYAPPSGLEGRKARAIIIPTQGDLDTLADAGDNRMSATVSYHAGYLYSREAAS